MINDTASTEFTKELHELRNAYLQALPDKVRLVQRAWQTLDPSNWDQAAYKSVYRLVHNLAGGAGIYGLNAISKQARTILETMKPAMDSDNPPDSALNLQISQGIEILDKTTNKTLLETKQETHHLRKPPVRPRAAETGVSEVFLVEDDAAQAHFLTLILGQAGHRVQVFDLLEDVKVALEAVEPTAILMDMVFPEGELAGAAALAEIQENQPIAIPIFFISTRTDLEARLSAVRAGASHYLTKPVNVGNLVRLLDEYRKPISEQEKHVLLIDDDPAVSSLFATHLEKEENLQTSLLSEPLEILETLEDKKPDLILMDYHMPDCNGLELAAVIRQHESYADIPIIFLTEETDIETQLTALNIGSDDFFIKSMGPDRLVLAVQFKLDRLESLTNTTKPINWSKN